MPFLLSHSILEHGLLHHGPIEAPLNDFTLMKALVKYPHKAVSDVRSKKLGLHLWHLSEELVALIDSRVCPETKAFMLSAMTEATPKHPAKRPRVQESAFLELVD